MSAYTRSGRSDYKKIKKTKGRKRPLADIGLARHILLLQESVGQIQ
jgi:hypothetical protein